MTLDFKKALCWIFFVVGLLFTKETLGQNVISVSASDEKLVLDTLWYYEDTDQLLTIGEAEQTDFTPLKKHNFGVTSSAYWVKLQIEKKTDALYFIAIDYPILDSLTVYHQNTNKEWVATTIGDQTELSRLEYKNYRPLIPLNNAVNEKQTYYLRFATKGTMITQVQIHSLPSLVWGNLKYNINTGIYYGAMIIMILYNLILFFFVKDKSYLWYVVAITGVPMYSASILGHAYLLFHGHLTWIGHEMLLMGASLYFVGIFFFTRHFLNVSKISQKLDKALIIFGIIGVLQVLGSKFLSYDLMALVVSRSMIIVQFIILGVAIYCWKKGEKAARFFLIAWFGFVVAGITRALAIGGILPDTFWTRYCTEISFFVQVILFSVALGDRYRLYRMDKERVQQQLLEVQKGQTEKLEELVKERTKEISLRKEEIMTQNEELQQQQEEILAQRDFIDTKNKELSRTNEVLREQSTFITDSIRYAKDIQRAILPKEKELQDAFEEYFVIYKPRDIVSGDFYWFGEVNNKKIFAVGDCTGHGVPGAFMSMIGNELLNQAVIENQIDTPEEILSRMHKGVRYALHQENKDNSDGMEVGIVVIDKQTQELQFAGAKLPLVYIQDEKMYRVRGSSQSIGGRQKEDKRTFQSHTISIKNPTCIYMFSDGYQDQFGSSLTSKRQKFQSNYLQDLLLEIHQQSLQEQKEILLKTLDEWQGDYPQIDDIIVTGIKL